MKLYSHKNSLGKAAFIVMTILCNSHLLLGLPPSWSLFRLDEVMHGQLWRLITHPFTHVSFYHLTVDLTATCMLFSQLRSSFVNRSLLFTLCSAASLLSVVLFSPHLLTSGYCGLSGTAHGFMSYLGIQWLHDSFKIKEPRFIPPLSGMIFLISSAGKSIFEVMTGEVLFSSLHMGELGIPLVHAHLGGAMGGILSYFVLQTLSSDNKQPDATAHSRCISSPSCDQAR